jgi:hypothetical protein
LFNLCLGGSTMVYQYEKLIFRTAKAYDLDLIALKKKRIKDPKYSDVRGVKGECILSELEFFHPIINSNVDVMHSVFLGVVKTLFQYWFDHTDIQYSLKKNLKTIDSKLLKIKPPSFIPTSPRSIFDWRNWRAKVFLYFIMYYSLPVFYKIMPDKQFNHLTFLIISLEILLSKNIYENDLKKAEYCINKFVSLCDSIYNIT